MRCYFLILTVAAFFSDAMTAVAQSYDYQNTRLKDDRRVELFLNHLTLDEKISWLSTRMSTPRLGMPALDRKSVV